MTKNSDQLGDSDDRPKYACEACGWRGDVYEIATDGSDGGRAVCPNCGGQLTLTAANDQPETDLA